MIKKILSYSVAILLGLLCVFPPIAYDFNLEVNSLLWVWLVCAASLICFFLFTQKIDSALKVLMIYIFFNCFISQVPFVSFNSFLVFVQIILFFLLCLYVDYEPLLDVMQAVFWLQVFCCVIQHIGMDTLMCFGREDKTVFFGTVFQQMRLGSLFSIMAPFLLMKSKWYIIPLSIVAFSLGTLGFTFSLAAGVVFYAILTVKNWRYKIPLILTPILVSVGASFTNNHIYIELKEGRWPVWKVILKTWYLDTTKNFHGFHSPLNPSVQTGPFDLERFLFGHGLNTFNALFPFYKYDPAAFRPAHNDWLQTYWELGLIGATIFNVLLIFVFYKILRMREFFLAACMVIIASNRFLSFPDRMWQTVLLEVCFMAFCYRKIKCTGLITQ